MKSVYSKKPFSQLDKYKPIIKEIMLDYYHQYQTVICEFIKGGKKVEAKVYMFASNMNKLTNIEEVQRGYWKFYEIDGIEFED